MASLADVIEGRHYRAPRPGTRKPDRGRGPKVTALQVGIARPGVRIHDGVLVALDEPTLQHGGVCREPGYQYVVAARHLSEWGDHDEQRIRDRDDRRAAAAALRERLIRLGLTESDEEAGGFRINGNNRHVTIAVDELNAWLDRQRL